MKRFCFLIGLVILLSGCGSRAVWETVEDPLPTTEVSSWLEEAYTIQIGVPERMDLLAEQEGCSLYSNADGSFEVETRVFLTAGLADAVQKLSGYKLEELNLLETTRFDLPEYQFSWVSQTERGLMISRADLVLEEQCCYAVICSSLESVGNDYDGQVREVLATFGLSRDETV